MSQEVAAKLHILARRLRKCTKCDLSATCQYPIPGYGNSSAEIMIVGVAVPYYLANKGIPFTGATGDTTRQVLRKVNLPEDRVYITNIVKCPLPRQDSTAQEPHQKQVLACAGWLDEEIRIVSPRLIITLGAPALRRFFPRESISSFLKDSPHESNGILYFALYHPANFHRGGQGQFGDWIHEPLAKLSVCISNL